jgi:hypothetical protein
LQLSGPGQPWQIRMAGDLAGAGLYRAGERIDGETLVEDPIHLGWYAWTYAHKEPNLHYVASQEVNLPLRIATSFILGDDDPQDLTLDREDSKLEVTWRGSQCSFVYPLSGDNR